MTATCVCQSIPSARGITSVVFIGCCSETKLGGASGVDVMKCLPLSLMRELRVVPHGMKGTRK